MLFPFSRYLSFCQGSWSCRKNGNIIDEKDKVNFKIHDVTTWFTNNCNTHVAHISQTKGNQTMKFGQLIEYNKGNIFLQKLCRK